jgi:hypothetical protein
MTFIFTTIAMAQQDTSATVIDMRQVQNTSAGMDAGNPANHVEEVTTQNAVFYNLSMLVLGFGLIIIGLETLLIFTKKISEENIVRFIIVTLIIISALFLITAGYSNNQIAPAIGLLGTVAGYLLGKTEK